jgi:hypothetical protein
MEYIVLKQESPSWEWCWNWLNDNPINAGITDPSIALNDGNAWEYMGTVRNKGIAISSFKHNSHPFDNEQKNISVQHLDAIPNEDIELIKPIK